MADDLSLYWSLFQGEFPGELIEDATTWVTGQKYDSWWACVHPK